MRTEGADNNLKISRDALKDDFRVKAPIMKKIITATVQSLQMLGKCFTSINSANNTVR